MKGQLSAEMLILITVVLAVVAIVAVQMMGTAQKTGESVQRQADILGNRTMEAMKVPPGGYCSRPGESDECQDGSACGDDYRCPG